MEKYKKVFIETKEQEQTKEFKKWFGKSKVVDSSGKPLIVYHGTNASFNSFDPIGKEHAWMGDYPEGAIFFTDNKKQASLYGKNVIEVYLKMNNPYFINLLKDEEYGHLSPEQYIDDYLDWSKFSDYGAIIVKGKNKHYTYSVYIMSDDNRDIKSATNNNGEFNPRSDNIMERYERLFEISNEEKDKISDEERIKVLRDTIKKLQYKIRQNKIELDYIDDSDSEGRDARENLEAVIDADEESIDKLTQDIEDIKNEN